MKSYDDVVQELAHAGTKEGDYAQAVPVHLRRPLLLNDDAEVSRQL